jgi:spoIIIJ-associated protein
MDEIKNLIKETLEAMGLKGLEIGIKKDNFQKEGESMTVSVEMSPRDAESFLREHGEGLDALERLIRVLLSKKMGRSPFLVLDINSYKESRKNELSEMAMDIAKKVRRSKKAVILEPMSPYERRIIHLKLAEQPDIVTESIGEEPERKVVVRLYP